MEEEVFRKCKFSLEKMIEFGFVPKDEDYEYREDILDGEFEVVLTYSNSFLKGIIIDKNMNEEYVAFRAQNQVGEFVNTIRERYFEILSNVKDKCCIVNDFLSSQANRISQRIKEKYGDCPEFLWDDEKNAVFRNSTNQKWYGILMEINQKKLGGEDRVVEVMNVKLSPNEIDLLVLENGFYRAYHMNKKYWITFVLDDTIEDEKIMELIEESYQYTIDVHEWVIPANPKYWDIIHYFHGADIVEWKQINNIQVGDIVYIYVGSPYSCILYKCVVLEKDIDSSFGMGWKSMNIRLLREYDPKTYPFELLKQYDLRAVRSARRMPLRLIEKMRMDEEKES